MALAKRAITCHWKAETAPNVAASKSDLYRWARQYYANWPSEPAILLNPPDGILCCWPWNRALTYALPKH